MIWRRVLSIIPLLLVVSFLVFALSAFLPGDAAVTLAGENASPERIEEIRTNLGLDKPLPVRYGEWLGSAVQGDLGRSLFTKRAVRTEITDRWLVTFQLVSGGVALSLLIGVPAGIIAGRSRGRWPDRIATLGATIGVAIPSFVIGLWLIVVLAIWLDLLPFAGYVPMSSGLWEWGQRMLIPTIAISGVMTAELTRQIRGGLVETLESDFIRTARAKGLSEGLVVNKHALRMAASPAISVLSVQVARLFGGAVVVEKVFSLPGLGSLIVDSIIQRDLPILQGVIPLAVLIAVFMTLIGDLLQSALNPRVRLQGA